MKTIVSCLLAASALAAMARPAHADDLSDTLAACGKPTRDVTTPTHELIRGARLRILTYNGVDLHFTSGPRSPIPGPGWHLNSADVGKKVIVDRAAIGDELPCLKLPAGVAAASSNDREIQDRMAEERRNLARFSGAALAIAFIVAALAFYLLPTIVASSRGVVQVGGIVALNLLLGWTLLGWIVALVWACSAQTKQQVRAQQIDYDRLAAAMRGENRPPPPSI